MASAESTTCLFCDAVMDGLHCKLICPACGYKEDCSDLFPECAYEPSASERRAADSGDARREERGRPA